MKMQSSKYLLGTASVLALLASSAATPANAQKASVATNPLYFGGSTLASEAFRQIFDCYTGGIVGYGVGYTDGFAFTSSVGPGMLPTSCTVATTVNGLYAGVGSGNGVRGFIANNPLQWYGGSVTAGTTTTTFLPAVQPSIIDYANTGTPVTKFGSYPYPRVDAGMSDSPLAFVGASTTLTTISFSFSPTQSWSTTGGALASITVGTSAAATYNPSAYGAVIQVPAFEVNVAIAVNTQSLTVKSAVTGSGTLPATQANQGAAIQLTAAQLCAIFSGLVTDWSNTTPNNIPYLDSSGTQQLAAFNYANADSTGTLQPYSSSSKTITVAYRSDGSGTSFILTNYLHNVCPLLDSSDTYKYKSIFGATNLPSTSFSALISNVNSFRTNGSTITGAWIGRSGSGGVASAISDDSADSGKIGYVSADFTRPYTTQIATGTTTVGAPYSAALQNEQLRIAGTYVPNNTTTTSLTFIAPTPGGAFNAWGDTRLQTAAATWTWANFNIYNNTFVTNTTTTQVIQGGVNVSGLSVLPLTNVGNAYPLSGTTFLDLYSCYSVQADANRVTSLVNFLTWYFGASNSLLTGVMQNAGFNPVPSGYATVIRNKYLGNISTSRIAAAGTANTGCSSATGAL